MTSPSSLSRQLSLGKTSTISSLEIQTSANQSKELTSLKNKNHPIAKVISFNFECWAHGDFLKISSLERPLVSLSSLKTPIQSSKTTRRSHQKNRRYLNPIFERKSITDIERNDISHRKRRDRRRRPICPLCSNCCCFASTIALLLFLIGLAALLVFILTSRYSTTTTITTTKTSEFFIKEPLFTSSMVI